MNKNYTKCFKDLNKLSTVVSFRIHIDLSSYKKISGNQGMAFKSFSASEIIKRLSRKTIIEIFEKWSVGIITSWAIFLNKNSCSWDTLRSKKGQIKWRWLDDIYFVFEERVVSWKVCYRCYIAFFKKLAKFQLN